MNEEQIQSIASAVKGLIDQDKEKSKISQQLNGVTKEVGELRGELGKIKEGMHCTSDGKYCFRTPEELQSFISSQNEKMDGVEAKITEVATQIKAIEQAGKQPATGLTLAQEFEKLPPEGQKELKGKIAKLIPHQTLLNIVKECSRSDSPEKCNPLRSILRDYDAAEIVAELPKEKGPKVVSIQCQDGECRLQLEKEGVRIYRKDEKGRWFWQDEPKEETKKGGFDVF